MWVALFEYNPERLMKRLPPVTQEEWQGCNEFNRNVIDEFIENSTELSPNPLKYPRYRINLMIWANWVRASCQNKRQVDIKSRDYLRFQNWLVGMDRSSSDITNAESVRSIIIILLLRYAFKTFKNFINAGESKTNQRLQ